MRLNFELPRLHTIAFVLGSSALVGGCIEPSTIGIETDGTDEGTGGSETSTGADTQGGTGPSMTSGTSTTTTTTADGGGETHGSETHGGACPPISVADCVECECDEATAEWTCSNRACVYDCTGLECGTACMNCPDDQPACDGIDFEGVCTVDGMCVPIPPPKGGFCSAAVEEGFEDTLIEDGGCGDLQMYANNGEDTVGLILHIDDGLFAEALATGGPVHREYSATDPEIELSVLAGNSVTALQCEDIAVELPEIDETWLPTAGMIIVDVTAEGPEQGTADFSLTGVVLERDMPGPGPLMMGDVTYSDINVGWLPG